MRKGVSVMNTSTLVEKQLLATKFFVPVAPRSLISRPRLAALLQESLTYPLTLVSAPAGFGKTTLLSTWGQSLPASYPLVAWVSLDEEDNEPRMFWTSVLAALNQHQPEPFTPLLKYLQSSQAPPFNYVLMVLINLLIEKTQRFLLILDDYHLITEQQVHTTFSYLVEHLPPQLRVILATRTDPPLPLSQLRASRRMLELRTNQLRCTTEETRAFFHQLIDIQLPDEAVQEVTARTEGWLVGLQLLGLSLPDGADPRTLLEQVSGDQRYILDYLTQEVLRQQPPEVQTFLLSTSILEQLSASLCDAIMQQGNSQQMLQRLEQANLFVASLDSKRQWYRYHALFAEALRYRLEHTQADMVSTLYHRASCWYAQHDRTTQAILYAFRAHQWQWAADLIERHPLLSLTWGASKHELVTFREWLKQLPEEVVNSRPRLCLACTQILWAVTPYPRLQAWLDAAEATLTASHAKHSSAHTSHPILTPQELQNQEDLLGEVIASRAFLQSFQGDGQTALALCQQALSLLSADNFMIRALVGTAQLIAFYSSSTNDAVAAIESGLQAVSLAQTVGLNALAMGIIGVTALRMIGAGQFHKIQQLSKQAKQLGTQPTGVVLPEVGWSAVFEAEILREHNELDAGLPLAREAISLCAQTQSGVSLTYLLCGYGVLLRIFLSRGELDAARTALQQFEAIGTSLNQHVYIHMCSFLTTVDQVRLWLACGEMERAIRWIEQLDIRGRHSNPFVHEREEVARMRILLANDQPDLVLKRLECVLQRATTGQRWSHVIEIRLLQALAHQMCQQERQALDVLAEAVRLAEPEGYIRSFVDEGALMAALLNRLQEEQCKDGPTPYLDKVLAAFPQQSEEHQHQLKRETQHSTAQLLLDPLSERELEVLQLVARGASNQEIAQELVIAVDTVKRHISHIFSKLDARNRVQAVRQARALDLLSEEH